MERYIIDGIFKAMQDDDIKVDIEITKAKQNLNSYKNKISAWIRNVCILMVLIIAWMAVGQLSLSTIGWVYKLREEALVKKNNTTE